MHYADNNRTTPFWNYVKDRFVPSDEMLSYIEDFKDPNIQLPTTTKYNTMFGGQNWTIFLIQLGYKIIEKNNEVYFKYAPPKNTKRNFDKKTSKESPFGILKKLNFN